MGDSGEGLVDASSRLQERMEEIQDSRRITQQGESSLDPERIRALESLRLAKIDLERQLSMTVHEVRRLHLVNALEVMDDFPIRGGMLMMSLRISPSATACKCSAIASMGQPSVKGDASMYFHECFKNV